MYVYRLSACESAFLLVFCKGLFVIRLFAIIGILLTLSLQLRVRMRLSTWLQYHLWEEVASTAKRMYQIIY